MLPGRRLPQKVEGMPPFARPHRHFSLLMLVLRPSPGAPLLGGLCLPVSARPQWRSPSHQRNWAPLRSHLPFCVAPRGLGPVPKGLPPSRACWCCRRGAKGPAQHMGAKAQGRPGPPQAPGGPRGPDGVGGGWEPGERGRACRVWAVLAPSSALWPRCLRGGWVSSGRAVARTGPERCSLRQCPASACFSRGVSQGAGSGVFQSWE